MAEEFPPPAAIYLLIQETIQIYLLEVSVIIETIIHILSKKRKRSSSSQPYRMIERIPEQIKHLNRLIGVNNVDCVSNLRMDRNTFGRLCSLLRELGGLEDGKYVTVEEQVSTFLCILAHHKKNRVVGFDYLRSSHTVSTFLHKVLKSVLVLHTLFLVKLDPVPDECTDTRWKWFKGCLGALDGTYINVKVPNSDKPRYRTRKGQISTNTLAVCDRNLRFVCVTGVGGSAADSRILRDAINRPHGLKVPKGNYYLCDNGYANSEGFLTSYRSVRYHLKEWGPEASQPQSKEEMFNMRHSKARNVIERAFGIMKMRWGILRSASYYPTKVQIRLITACFLLHNFIRSEMETDPIEQVIDEDEIETTNEEHDHDVDYIDSVEASTEWNQKRDLIAQSNDIHEIYSGILLPCLVVAVSPARFFMEYSSASAR